MVKIVFNFWSLEGHECNLYVPYNAKYVKYFEFSPVNNVHKKEWFPYGSKGIKPYEMQYEGIVPKDIPVLTRHK